MAPFVSVTDEAAAVDYSGTLSDHGFMAGRVSARGKNNYEIG